MGQSEGQQGQGIPRSPLFLIELVGFMCPALDALAWVLRDLYPLPPQWIHGQNQKSQT